MPFVKTKNVIVRAVTLVLRQLHYLMSLTGLVRHYTLYGLNTSGGFYVSCKENVLQWEYRCGCRFLSFSPYYNLNGKSELIKITSAYDWPIHLLGEYKPWKVTFKKH